MDNTELIRNLLIKIGIDGSFSICDTCIQQDNNNDCGQKVCRYKNNCTDKLEGYIPNTDIINS